MRLGRSISTSRSCGPASYFPPFLEARKTTEKALVAVIQEAWIAVSTRRVDEIAQAMGLSGISKSQVSKLCKEIDERVKRLPAARRRLALSVAGCDLPESARGRTHRLGRRDNRCGRQHRRTARDRRARHWPCRKPRPSGGLPEAPDQTRPARRQARDLGRARRAEGRRPAGRRRDMATLSRALHA